MAKLGKRQLSWNSQAVHGPTIDTIHRKWCHIHTADFIYLQTAAVDAFLCDYSVACWQYWAKY